MGPGVPWAIGAQLGRPGKQTLLMSGDGAFGVCGMEIETAAKYNLPIVIILSNNASWGGGQWAEPRFGKGRDFQPDLRYEKMAEGLGCHGEYVAGPEDVKPALERAFNSGKPALLNVPIDRNARPGIYGGAPGVERKMKVRFF